MLVDKPVDLDPDCRLKVAVSFLRSGNFVTLSSPTRTLTELEP